MEGHFSVSTGILNHQAPAAFAEKATEVIPEYDRITAQDIFAVTCFTIGSGGIVLIPLFCYAVYSLFIKDEKKENAELTALATQTYQKVYGEVFEKLTELNTQNKLNLDKPDPVLAFIQVDGEDRQFRITQATEDNRQVLTAGFVDGDQFKKEGTLLELFKELSSQEPKLKISLDEVERFLSRSANSLNEAESEKSSAKLTVGVVDEAIAIKRVVNSIKIYSDCAEKLAEQVAYKSNVGLSDVVDEQAHDPVCIFLRGEREVNSQRGAEVRRPYVFSAPAPALAASGSAYDPIRDMDKATMLGELATNYPRGGRYLDASGPEPTFNKENFTKDINAMMSHALKAVGEHADIKQVVLAPFEESIYAHDLKKIDKGTEGIRYPFNTDILDLDKLYSLLPDNEEGKSANSDYSDYKTLGFKHDAGEQELRKKANEILGGPLIQVDGSKAFQAEARSIVAAAYADLIMSLREEGVEVVYSDNRVPHSILDIHFDFWAAVNSDLQKKRANDITPVQNGNSDIDQGWVQDTDMIFNFFDSRYLVGQQTKSPRKSFNERLGQEMPLVPLAHAAAVWKYKQDPSNHVYEYGDDFSLDEGTI